MAAYYNEIDPFAAQWLRELIKAGLIADGEVDERDIRDVQADDVKGFTQCHFFAGIGGWSYALRLAGWPDDRPVWTGSCPCQPFSAAGRGHGEQDARHLWPVWFPLICECRPAIVFGEQTASRSGWTWLDAVCDNLEDENYAVAAADLPAASVGAPHERQRIWFIANAISERPATGTPRAVRAGCLSHRNGVNPAAQHERNKLESGPSWNYPSANADVRRRGQQHTAAIAVDAGQHAGVLDASRIQRRIESRPEPVGDGIPARVGRLRGYGNAIVPQVAQAFIEAYMKIGSGNQSSDAKRAVTTNRSAAQ